MNGAIRVVRRIILDDSELATALKTATGHGVRPGDASEVDETPYVLLWVIFDRPYQSLAGREQLRTALVQVDCYAATKSRVAAIAARISDRLAAFGRGNADDVWVAEIIQEDTRDRDERDREGADRPLAVIQTDYRITFKDNLQLSI